MSPDLNLDTTSIAETTTTASTMIRRARAGSREAMSAAAMIAPAGAMIMKERVPSRCRLVSTEIANSATLGTRNQVLRSTCVDLGGRARTYRALLRTVKISPTSNAAANDAGNSVVTITHTRTAPGTIQSLLRWASEVNSTATGMDRSATMTHAIAKSHPRIRVEPSATRTMA